MAAMSRRIYYNVPCILFRDFLKSDTHTERVLGDVLRYAVYVEYMRLQNDVPDEEERFLTACRNMGAEHLCKNQVLMIGDSLFRHGKNEAFVSLDSAKYWEQVNERKTPEQRALFLAWIALKSIIGNKPYIKTNNALWLSRMDGSSTTKGKQFKKKSIYSDEIEKYNSPYRCRRLRALLFQYYRVSFFSDGVRGFYFSLTLNLEELIKAVKQRPRTDAIGKYNEAKRAALEAFNHEFNHDCNLK